MNLEARAANCFSTKFVLKTDERPIGKFEGRWFSESLDVYLTERRHIQFNKIGWLSSQFDLVELAREQPLARCYRSGVFSSNWNMLLSVGPGSLKRVGWFASGYEFEYDGQVLAAVNRLGWCDRGWRVEASDTLLEEDLLMIGLVYHVIQQRQAQQQHAGGHAAGT